MKFPVFSLLAGNLAFSETSSQLTPPSSGESIANLTFGRADGAVAKATALFAACPTGAGDPTLRGIAGIGNLIRGEAYVLGYIDGFWIIAWVLTAGIVLLLLLRSPLPNPMR